MKKYMIGIDQSTQGTKLLLLDENGKLVWRAAESHRQLVNDQGWVSHDGEEIYNNIISLVRKMLAETHIKAEQLRGVGISNQRETAITWRKIDGKPAENAIVWQCSRASELCKGLEEYADFIRERTGIPLSPFFTAAKIAWLLKNCGLKEAAECGEICAGTMDAYIIYRLTHGKSFKTDYSNGSRTQLMNIQKLEWDKEITKIFGIPNCCLPELVDSNALFGYTDFEGMLDVEIPIHAAAGDSHAALFAHHCTEGYVKATYGTGSSVMMNIGKNCKVSKNGLTTSVGWSLNGETSYVLEGNVNYTGSVISWLKNDVGLISSPKEVSTLAFEAAPEDTTYIIPAFSGLGAPHWNNNAKAMICGMTRNTGKKELVRAADECIAYQIADVLRAMEADSGMVISQLRTDGGATKDNYLMQFQSDITQKTVKVSDTEELSGIGAAYMAGIALGYYEADVLATREYLEYSPQKDVQWCKEKYSGWCNAIETLKRSTEQ